MKYFLTLLSILTITLNAYSQITWDKADADTARGFETEPDIETHNKVTFTKAGTYRWIRTYEEKCSIKTAICDKNSCYLETTDSADFTVVANESFDMICHFYPYNKCCPDGAKVTLYVFKVDEPSINSTASYPLDLWCASSSVSDIASERFGLYPNPATSDVSLTGDVNAIEDIQITNIAGKVVSNPTPENGSIDVAGLKSGIYFIAIRTENEIYTHRFIKN